MEVKIVKHKLIYNRPARTSRNILNEKDVYYILIKNNKADQAIGIGEASVIPGLSIDDIPAYEEALKEIVPKYFEEDIIAKKKIEAYPSIQFAIETALLDLENGGRRVLIDSKFTKEEAGIHINGLIWMGDKRDMVSQIEEKLNKGFRCLKLKVGAINFEDELDVLSAIREQFSKEVLEIRLDANGAFHPSEVLKKLNQFSEFHIHSIEQPLMPGLIDESAELCRVSPIPIALDEELIGIKSSENRKRIIQIIKPAYVIIKPSLLGGFNIANDWIKLAIENQVGWWITSALESNIGLNAIAQYAYALGVYIPQGLGTGLLYRNNIPSPLYLSKDYLWYSKTNPWNYTNLKKQSIC